MSSPRLNDAAAPLVGVVTVNWNSWKDTVESIGSVAASGYPDVAHIIVDNASRDDSVEQLGLRLPQALLIASNVNTGFAGGCNLGIAKAIELGCRYVYLLNVDAQVRPQTLSRLVEASAELGDTAALGSVLKYVDSGKYQFFGSRTGAKTGYPVWYDEAVDSALLDEPLIETDFIIGAALFAPTRLFNEVGLFDERFFLNFEETDWCYRVRAAGFGCFMAPGSVVMHKANGTVGSIEAPLQTYFCLRNELLFLDKHATLAQRLGAYRRLGFQLCRRVVKTLLARRIELRTRAIFLAARDYLLKRFGDCPDEIRTYAKLHSAGQK